MLFPLSQELLVELDWSTADQLAQARAVVLLHSFASVCLELVLRQHSQALQRRLDVVLREIGPVGGFGVLLRGTVADALEGSAYLGQ